MASDYEGAHMTTEELTKKLQAWRKNKKFPSERIPEEYWQEAVNLAKKHGKPANLAKKLGLSANDLKKKMGISIKKRKKNPQVHFQEIKLDNSNDRQPIFELITAQGLTLKVYQ